MAEERTLSNNQLHSNILNMTLGQILNNNPSAQNMIMQSMGLNQEQFQQMLSSAGNNQMLNMTVSDLFKNGTITQAMQIKPEQLQQIINNPAGQIQELPNLTLPQKQTFLQKLRNLFR